MSDLAITTDLKPGYHAHASIVSNEALALPQYPNGCPNTFTSDFQVYCDNMQTLLKNALNQPVMINFSQAFVLMQEGRSVISPSTMDKRSYLRLMDDTGVLRLYLYEYHGAQCEYIRRALDTVDTNLILATDWALFVDLDKK